MKHLLTTTILLITTGILIISQEISMDFGRITDYELRMSSYGRDPQAGAVVIYDKGLSRFAEVRELTFEVFFERSTKIKILKDSGVKYGTFSIPFYQENNIREQVKDLVAITYNLEDGKIIKTAIRPQDVHEEKINEYWMAKKFAMPDVRPGSVIEIRYTITSPYLVNLRDWEFQWDIPVISSEYVARMVPFYEYSYILQGSGKFDRQTSQVDKSFPRHMAIPGAPKPLEFFDMVYTFGMEYVPAYADNEFITSRSDYIIKIDFQLARVHQLGGTQRSVLSTWPELIKGMQREESFGKYVSKSTSQMKSLLGNTKKTGKSELELYHYIMTYVKTNYIWNGNTAKYASKTADRFVRDKEGNSADINLFAVGMLQAAGIKAFPLLVSTRQNGKIKHDYPFLHFFNNVVVAAMIGNEYFVGDATEPLISNIRLPERCINDKGLIIGKGDPVWLSLEALNPSAVSTLLLLNVTDKATRASVQKSYTEYDAFNMRRSIESDEATLRTYAENQHYLVDEESWSLLNLNDPEKPLIVRFIAEQRTESIADRIYISPFMNEPLKNNPLTQTTRTQPVDFIYPLHRSYASVIDIPEGYEVESIPSCPAVDTPLFKMSYVSEQNGNTISISLQYQFKLSTYQASDYNTLKRHFNDIIKYSNEKIVLRKL